MKLLVFLVIVLFVVGGCSMIHSHVHSKFGVIPRLVEKCEPPRIAILLTMYVSPDRYSMYEEAVKQWLTESTCDIYAVDSYGLGLPTLQNNRLHVFAFKQQEPASKKGLTQLERNSILKAEEQFRSEWTKYDLIFKITGKYFIPHFQEVVCNYIPRDSDLVFQYSTNYWQNSEIVGYKPRLIVPLVSKIQNKDVYEKVLKGIGLKRDYKIYRLPPLKLTKSVKKSDGTVVSYL